MTARTIIRTLTVLLIAMAYPTVGYAADAPLTLKWAELRPKGVPMLPPKPKTFFSGVPKRGDDGGPPPPPLSEGKFMSMKRRQPGAGRPPRVVPELNGKLVKLGGYIVPLDFEATRIKEFLLVPFVGACIHVPPPPANQIVYVKSEKGVDITGSFDPVSVTGTITTESAATGLADAGYSIDADAVEILSP
jgi:uncharacterized protein